MSGFGSIRHDQDDHWSGPNGWAWAWGGNGGDDDLSYSFTIANGSVTGEDVIHNGHARAVTLSSSDSFTLGTGTVTETVTLSNGTATLQYALESGSTTLYQEVGRSFTVTDATGALPGGGTDTFSFTLTGGAVTGESETVTFGSASWTHAVTAPSDAVFTVGTGTITESWVSGDQIHSVTYAQLQNGTDYAVSTVSSSVIAQGTATTALDVRPGDKALFTIDSSGTVSAAQFIRPDGGTIGVTPDSHISFSELASGYVEAIVGSGSHTHFVVYYDGAGSGTYTEIAHGGGSAVDLVGLKAQIAELSPTLSAAI
jgi:hypothetical protein